MLTFRVDGCWPLSFSLSTSVSTFRAGPSVSRCFVQKCYSLTLTAKCLPCVLCSVCFLVLNNSAPGFSNTEEPLREQLPETTSSNLTADNRVSRLI